MPQVTTGAVSGVLAIPQNRLRRSIVFENLDATDSIYIREGDAADITSTNADHKLAPGASIAFNSLLDGSSSITNRWAALATANTPILAVKETEDVVR